MNNNVRTYRDLIVWSDSKLLAEKVYNVTKYLPSEERFGLASQMQRAAVSIPSNIAEGNKGILPKITLDFYILPEVP